MTSDISRKHLQHLQLVQTETARVLTGAKSGDQISTSCVMLPGKDFIAQQRGHEVYSHYSARLSIIMR